MSLSVSNAAIYTATVEIKILTVAGKQMTLSVFRQLLEIPLITTKGEIRGIPWGIVNYHPDGCAPQRIEGSTENWDDMDHVHVVWQDGPLLRRAAAAPPRPRNMRGLERFEAAWAVVRELPQLYVAI